MTGQVGQFVGSVTAAVSGLVLAAGAWHEHPLFVSVVGAVLIALIMSVSRKLSAINRASTIETPARLAKVEESLVTGGHRFDLLDERLDELRSDLVSHMEEETRQRAELIEAIRAGRPVGRAHAGWQGPPG